MTIHVARSTLDDMLRNTLETGDLGPAYTIRRTRTPRERGHLLCEFTPPGYIALLGPSHGQSSTQTQTQTQARRDSCPSDQSAYLCPLCQIVVEEQQTYASSSPHTPLLAARSRGGRAKHRLFDWIKTPKRFWR